MIPQEFIMNMSNETVMDAVEDDEEAMMALENTRENVTARPPITGVTNVIPPLLS